MHGPAKTNSEGWFAWGSEIEYLLFHFILTSKEVKVAYMVLSLLILSLQLLSEVGYAEKKGGGNDWPT